MPLNLDKTKSFVDNIGMKMFLTAVILASSLFLPNDTAFIIVSQCFLYSDASFTSEIVKDNGEEYILYQNDKVTIISESDDFVLVETDDQQTGYVYKYYLSKNSSQTVYPVFNCSVRNDSPLLDINKNETGIMIEAGKRVFVYNGFDNLDGYTEVQIVLEDGSLYSGIIKSDDLNPDGINGLIFIAIPLIMAAVTVILSVVLIKKKKKKKAGS